MTADWDTSDPLAEARRRDGIVECDFDGENIALVLRYDDARAVAAEFETYSSDAPCRVPVPSEEHVRTVRQLPIESDPPAHTLYKAIVRPFFSRPKSAAMASQVRTLIAGMLDDVLDTGEVEAVRDFALPLQSRALALLLRLPLTHAEEWIEWGTHVFHDKHSDAAGNRGALDGYLQRQFDHARAHPGDDFFSVLSQAEIDGRPLSREEMLGFANLAFAGGRDTVIATISLTLAHLASRPADLERLRDDPLLVRSAVEEIVRFASPLTVIGRVCPRRTRLHGVSVRPGGRVGICWASANRDPTVFERPERLEIDRKPNPHLAFGAGPHRCLGASHARLVLRTLIDLLAEKVERLTLVDSTPKIEAWPAFRRQAGYEYLTIRFESR